MLSHHRFEFNCLLFSLSLSPLSYRYSNAILLKRQNFEIGKCGREGRKCKRKKACKYVKALRTRSCAILSQQRYLYTGYRCWFNGRLTYPCFDAITNEGIFGNAPNKPFLMIATVQISNIYLTFISFITFISSLFLFSGKDSDFCVDLPLAVRVLVLSQRVFESW